jgi:hypothetical protein
MTLAGVVDTDQGPSLVLAGDAALLPILVSAAEADAARVPWPDTGASDVRIDRVDHGVLHAVVTFPGGAVDVRPSAAVRVAVGEGLTIWVADDVVDRAGFTLPPEEAVGRTLARERLSRATGGPI